MNLSSTKDLEHVFANNFGSPVFPILAQKYFRKAGVPQDVYAIDMLVSQVENKVGRKKKIGFELIVETSMGITNLDSIISGSDRVESLHFGYADYAASVRMRTTNIGGSNSDYSILTDESNGERVIHWNDMWLYQISKINVVY